MLTAHARELTLNYLRTLLDRGVENAPLTDEARQVLRRWVIEARKLARGEQVYTAAVKAADTLSTSAEDTTGTEPNDNITIFHREILNEVENLRHKKEEPVIIPEHIAFELDGHTPEEKLLSLQELIMNWQPLHELGSLRNKAIFGMGNPRAAIMMVADAPGAFEELHGIPMAGPAGKKLDAMLKAMGLSRNHIYLTYLVKRRPALPKQLTNNRPPTETEIALFRLILQEEVKLVRPQIIVALGPIAARGILNSGQTPLSALRGKFHSAFDTPVRVTYNPSYLLRTEDISEKRKVWEDLLCVMEHISLPISEKQRSYFLPKK